VSALVHDARAAPTPWRRETVTLGMWVFLATEVMFFGVLLFAYLRARLGDPQGFAAASHHTHTAIGSINTAILLTSSFFMALAADAASAEARRTARRWLLATALLGLVFIALKGVEYALEWRDGLVPGLHFLHAGDRTLQLFFYLYFVTTGLHAVHLAIGIALLSVLAWKLGGADLAVPSNDAIEVAGLYWHFVDVVWIFLYPLFYLVDLHG
jgi:cytochrome c oxidase subunit 3